MERWASELEACQKAIRQRTVLRPEVGLILGSGLGFLAERVTEAVEIPYAELPGFPTATVVGHAGKLVLGKLGDRPVAIMKGRFHYYEGYPMEKVAMGARLLCQLGIGFLLVTNASGAIRKGFQPGDLMLICDHINLMGNNPLIGHNVAELGTRFPDLSDAYSRDLRRQAHEVAARLQIPLQEGVYAAFSGPSYETPAEIRMVGLVGADAVGMSTVPEVIAACHLGKRVLGLSCLSNLAAGISSVPLSHDEVQETAEKVKDVFSRLVLALVEELR